ncbi:hypothetical protein CY34DRAFT_813767, partial [Suillus luteus UH-Slu-Lm8-n1]
MDPAASRRLSAIVIRGMEWNTGQTMERNTGQTMERKKTEKMSLCSSRGWRTDIVIAHSSDVIIQMCCIGCTLGDAST